MEIVDINLKKVNVLSEKLEQEVKRAMPKPGQMIWFTSVRPNARGTTVLPYDRIFDPYAPNTEGTEGDYVDIAYITGRDPGKGPGGLPKDILGRIQFNKPADGRIGIRGGDRAGEQMFKFLYLTNQLRNNQPTQANPEGKGWFVPGKQAVCFMEEPDKTADQKIEDARKIRNAGQAIDDMSDSKLRDFAAGLDMKGITSGSTSNEIRVKLLAIANTVQGAERVLSLDKDASLKVKIDVKEAEKLKIIRRNSELRTWNWVDGDEVICVIPPGKKDYDPIIAFFLGKGSESYRLVKQLADKERKSKEDK